MKLLVVDEGFIGSMQTAWGLSRAGIDVVLAGAVGGDYRYQSPALNAVTTVIPSHPEFADRILELAKANGCDAIFAATEPVMLGLRSHVADRITVVPDIDERRATLIADKTAMSRLAESVGVRIPRQQLVMSPHALLVACAEHGLPLVVKPLLGRGGAGVRIIATQEEANACALASARWPLVVQEYISGATYLVGGLFDAGVALRLYAGRKTEQQPARTGPASRIRSVADPALTAAALRIFEALAWTGLGSADFQISDTGELYFLEVNPRPWGSIAAAAEAGVDLFHPLACMLRGEVVKPQTDYVCDVETRVFPLYLLHRSVWLRPRTAVDLARDLRAEQGAPFRDAAYALHIYRRLRRVRALWPAG